MSNISCTESDDKCEWCQEDIIFNIRNKVTYLDNFSNEYKFCGYKCKSLFLQQEVDVFYDKVNQCYTLLKAFMGDEEESEE